MTPNKPVLFFDGDCGFCRRWIERWREITGNALDYAPSEKPESSVILIDVDGKTFRGAEAVFRSLALSPSHRWLSWTYYRLPGVKLVSEALYRLVASHRRFFSAIIRPSSYSTAQFFFLRGMGFVYFIAFASLGVQILGLIGSNGILPTQSGVSDSMLQLLCWGGVVSSVLVTFGVLPALFLFLNWVFYLSLVHLCGPFLSFQWDALLLEAGFLAIFLVPQSVVIRFLLKLLLFRLMFFSGFVKLAFGDPVWKNLTAMQFYYETQPLPPWTAWYAHHGSASFHTASCLFVFAVELIVPFFIFFPERIRHVAAAILICLQLLIISTGNYCFFNLLTLLLCLLLLEDSAWRKKLKSPKARDWPWPITGAVGVVVILMTFGALRVLEPLKLVNRYGLFANMTTERPEIILEGSEDGKNWLTYDFKYKVGDIQRKPVFVAPYQPRLDWQMWFAALGSHKQNGWFIRLGEKILEGSPDVLRLLEKNPFPDRPPRYLRALVYDYHFTNPAERKETGAWWRRELKGLYCPVLERRLV